MSTSSRVQQFLQRARNIKENSKSAANTGSVPKQSSSPRPRVSPSQIANNRSISPQAVKQQILGPQIRRISPIQKPAPKQESLSPKPSKLAETVKLRASIPSSKRPPMPLSLNNTPKASPRPGSASRSPINTRSPRRQPANKPDSTIQSQSPRQPGSRGSSTTPPPIDQGLVSSVEQLLMILSRTRRGQAQGKEHELIGRVKESLKSYKSWDSPRGSDSETSSQASYKQKAKKLLTIVKEETMIMDGKLEALKEEGAALRERLEAGDTPSTDELIELEASNGTINPEHESILARFKTLTVTSEYADAIEAQTAAIFEGIKGDQEVYKDLTASFAKKIVSEQLSRYKTIEQTNTMLDNQKHVIQKLQKRETMIEDRGPEVFMKSIESDIKEELSLSPEKRIKAELKVAQGIESAANKMDLNVNF